MSPLTLGPRTVSETRSPTGTVSAESVRARAASLTSALEAGAGCLPTGGVDRAEVVIAKAAARISITGGHTVVALAGATGSGKSSLFNDLVGADIAHVGVRRPTTAKPKAAVWGTESASRLLDWLMVGARHLVDAPGLDLEGLVLLDLPDFDSHEVAHRLEAERVLDLADVFIWVTDPQKYADARLHEDYIAKLSAHDAVTVVVLNQADRLTPEALAACRSDLVRLLEGDGVMNAEVIATSATQGSGVADLRQHISAAVAGHRAALVRLDSDLRSAASVLRSGVADSEPRLDEQSDAALVDALTRAAGIPTILNAVERDFRRETWARTGWPFTRWARALRPAPLKRLGLSKDPPGPSGVITQSDMRSVLGRSSLPPATPAARSAVELATRELGDQAGRDLPQAWTDAVSDAAMPPGEDLADALDQAVVGTSLRTRNPLWWVVFGFLQGILAVTAIVGLVWLMVLMALGWLQFAFDPPRLGPFPYPFLLLAGGLLIGLLLSNLTRAAGRVGARRRRRVVSARLREKVSQVSRDGLVAPVQKVLDQHRITREHLAAALARQT